MFKLVKIQTLANYQIQKTEKGNTTQTKCLITFLVVSTCKHRFDCIARSLHYRSHERELKHETNLPKSIMIPSIYFFFQIIFHRSNMFEVPQSLLEIRLKASYCNVV